MYDLIPLNPEPDDKSFEVGDGKTTITYLNGSVFTLLMNDFEIALYDFTLAIKEHLAPALINVGKQFSFIVRDLKQSEMIDYDFPWEIYNPDTGHCFRRLIYKPQIRVSRNGKMRFVIKL